MSERPREKSIAERSRDLAREALDALRGKKQLGITYDDGDSSVQSILELEIPNSAENEAYKSSECFEIVKGRVIERLSKKEKVTEETRKFLQKKYDLLLEHVFQETRKQNPQLSQDLFAAIMRKDTEALARVLGEEACLVGLKQMAPINETRAKTEDVLKGEKEAKYDPQYGPFKKFVKKLIKDSVEKNDGSQPVVPIDGHVDSVLHVSEVRLPDGKTRITFCTVKPDWSDTKKKKTKEEVKIQFGDSSLLNRPLSLIEKKLLRAYLQKHGVRVQETIEKDDVSERALKELIHLFQTKLGRNPSEDKRIEEKEDLRRDFEEMIPDQLKTKIKVDNAVDSATAFSANEIYVVLSALACLEQSKRKSQINLTADEELQVLEDFIDFNLNPQKKRKVQLSGDQSKLLQAMLAKDHFYEGSRTLLNPFGCEPATDEDVSKPCFEFVSPLTSKTYRFKIVLKDARGDEIAVQSILERGKRLIQSGLKERFIERLKDELRDQLPESEEDGE